MATETTKAVASNAELGQETERAAFEVWAKDQGFDVTPMDGLGCGFAGYRELLTNVVFQGFCAGAAAERERWEAAAKQVVDAHDAAMRRLGKHMKDRGLTNITIPGNYAAEFAGIAALKKLLA